MDVRIATFGENFSLYSFRLFALRFISAFTSTGAITFGNAVPIIMGQNIGTCITAILASTGTSKNAKRASLVHLLFNVLGAVIGLTIFCLLRYVYKLPLFNGSIDMWGIAAVHTIFNLLAFVVLFPIRRVLERIAVTLVADKRE